MTWLPDEHAWSVPVRARSPGTLATPPTGRLVPELVPVPRESGVGPFAGRTAAPVLGAGLVWRSVGIREPV